MYRIPLKIAKSLENRKEQQAFRQLQSSKNLVDFASNDYLGFSSSESIYNATSSTLKRFSARLNGAGGSRLLTGNHELYVEAEPTLADFHQAEAVLIFNSGYDANLGLISGVAKRGDLILFDELSHASIRDGISLSMAKSLKFRHNDLEDLQRLLINASQKFETIIVVTESVFSMDGDSPDVPALVELCENFDSFLIVDEAHSIGVSGSKGEGLIQEVGLQDRVFARVVTFGKAMGAHGAAVLGSNRLKEYLINFARSFIYTTGLPPHTVGTILAAYRHMEKQPPQLAELKENIRFFKTEVENHKLKSFFIKSDSAIHCCVIPGNAKVKKISRCLADKGFDVRAILSPTVPAGKERLRFCLHSFNTQEEIKAVLALLNALLEE